MKVQQAKQILIEAGYFVDNLWTIRDVQDKFECDNETATGILNNALTSEYIVENVFEQIDYYATCKNLTEKL